MKPRHAAALALVGWYLMTPPIAPGALDNPQQAQLIRASAPLSEWGIVHSFDTADECKAAAYRARMEAYRSIVKEFKEHKSVDRNTAERAKETVETQDTSAQCIASDDPRLKSK